MQNNIMESQNVEYKQSWRDEYLKWICGFANAQGGTLYIGVDDNGEVCRVENAKRIMEDIPNKVCDVLGIIVDVQLLHKDGKDYIEIVTPPYSNPISYKGQYHYRSGSTKQELKGAALTRFLQEKTGIQWDEYSIEGVLPSDLSQEAFARFRKEAAQSGRVDEEVLKDSDEALLINLSLLTAKQHLRRASILLFHPQPELYVTGAFVKIGFFGGEDDDLLFQDEIHGPLMLQVDKVMDLLTTKYLYRAISYEGTHRREKLIYPEGALRESVLNAIVHKDYTTSLPIQISVYPDHIVLWNAGRLPENWTVAKLYEKHSSQAFNPLVANAFFRAGDIEAWGRGYRRIARHMKEAHLLPPVLLMDNGLMVTFYADAKKQMQEMGLDERQMQVMEFVLNNGKITNTNVQEMFKTTRVTALRILSSMSAYLELIGGKGKDSYYILRFI